MSAAAAAAVLLLLLLLLVYGAPLAAAACVNNDAALATLAAAVGVQGVTSCAAAVNACLAPNNFGAYVRNLCPVTCVICPPPSPCDDIPSDVTVTAEGLGLAVGAALPSRAELVAAVKNPNCTTRLMLADFSAPAGALPEGYLTGFPALTTLSLSYLGLTSLAAADLDALSNLTALFGHCFVRGGRVGWSAHHHAPT